MALSASDSNGKDVIVEYKYPDSYPNDNGYSSLVSRNIIKSPIEEIRYSGDKEIYRIRKNYHYNMIGTIRRSFPLSVSESFSGEKDLKDIESYQILDFCENPVECINKEGLKVFYFWTNEGNVFAEIKNATKEQLLTALNVSSLESLSSPLKEPDYEKFANIRSSAEMKDVLITTYTYKPLVGMTSMTDPRGVTTTYEYDSFGRLKTAKDANGKVVQTYDYHYQNQ